MSHLVAIDPKSFCLKKMFALSGASETNVSHRCSDFFDTFLDAANHCCQDIPHEVEAADFSSGGGFKKLQILLEGMIDQGPQGQGYQDRVPIKLVGTYLSEQKSGVEGRLAIEKGSCNLFICRGTQDLLYFVRLSFQENLSWHVNCFSFEMQSIEAILAQYRTLRLFYAKRG